MKLSFFIEEIETQPLRLKGELDPESLGVGEVDELIHVRQPLVYDFLVQKLGDAVLIQGSAKVVLDCECARCLKSFALVLDWPDWTVHLPLTGEDRVELDDGEVDLTPILREDTLLRFPQHPLCEPACSGLAHRKAGGTSETRARNDEAGSVWSALNQLKLK